MTTVTVALDEAYLVELEINDLDSEFWIGSPADLATALTLKKLFPGRAPVRVVDGPAAGRTSAAFFARRADDMVILFGEESFSPADPRVAGTPRVSNRR